MDTQPPPPPPCWSNIVKQQPPPRPPPQITTTPATVTAAVAAETAAKVGNGVMVGSCKSTKGIAVAVVDANAIIQGGDKLNHSADRFVTVPEVLAEIRDRNSRHSLNLLPFTIDTTEPSPDSLKKGWKFFFFFLVLGIRWNNRVANNLCLCIRARNRDLWLSVLLNV